MKHTADKTNTKPQMCVRQGREKHVFRAHFLIPVIQTLSPPQTAYFLNMLSNDLIHQEIKRRKRELQLRKQRQSKLWPTQSGMVMLMSLLMSCSQSKEKIAPRITAFVCHFRASLPDCNVQCASNAELLLKSLWLS